MTLTNEQLKQLQLLNICPQKLRKDLLKRFPLSCIKAICECSLNALSGNIELSRPQKKCLHKYKNTLRKLADRKTSLHSKRKLIVQKGGFLNILIPAAITAISGLLNGIR